MTDLSARVPRRIAPWLARCAALTALAVGVGTSEAARAVDLFVLKTGGEVQGQLLNPSESPRKIYQVRTAAGAELAFNADMVKQVIPLSESDLLYAKLRPTTPDTVAGHEKLAAWCLERKLINKRQAHLERILELDPNHEAARAALGYTKSQGEWITRTDLMERRGLHLYQQRYCTVQEIQLAEEERRAELATREWQSRVKRWRSWLGTNKSAEATAELRKITDPLAVTALAAYLTPKEPRPVKLLMVEALGQIESPLALRALGQASIQDPDQEVRLSCLDAIVKRKDAGDAVNMYINSLQSKLNAEVNRAAQALRVLGDPSAVEALFDALITEHKFQIITKPAGQTSASFPVGGRGGGGMSFGGDGPKTVRQEMKNPEVLLALVKLTGQNHGYDVEDWKRWYVAQQRAANFNARRD